VALIYKITPESLWASALAMGVFEGAPVDLADGYIHFSTGDQVQVELDRLIVAAKEGHFSLQVNAGHGINYTNIAQVLTIPHLAELNIGHSIIARSTRIGLTAAVREMKELMALYSL
jgi:pyridoxine 5-phosphate synthase